MNRGASRSPFDLDAVDAAGRLAHLSLKVTSVTLPKLPVPRNISVSKSSAVNRVSCSSMKLSKDEA